MAEISGVDFDFFCRLSSLYTAMTSSAVSPVVVPSGMATDKSISRFSSVFYDAADDEESALKVVRERFRLNYRSIRRHFTLHERARDEFYAIDEAINTSNRDGIVCATRNLVGNVMEYSIWVFDHAKALGEKAFLQYPICISGHYFQVPGDKRVAEKSFNSQQTFSGTISGVKAIKMLLPGFEAGSRRVPSINLSDGQDSGEGIMDTSLRGRLDLNKELLKRAGFVV